MRIALVTCAEARPLDEDLPPLLEALERAGVECGLCDWTDPEVDWASWDAAVIRSPWDYFHDLDAFLAWAGEVDAQTRLLNPLPVVRWSCDKRYLRDLTKAGVPVVPTRFVEPGEEVPAPSGDVVVKPAVGAGSNDALRVRPGSEDAARRHIEAIIASGRAAMIQPYLSGVDAAGETGLLFAGGAFSHAVRKGAILDAEEVVFVEGLYAEEDISPRTPSAAELAVAHRALAVAPGATTYARIDLIPGPDGSPVVLEVEMVEPSLFLHTAPGAAERFAVAISSAAATRL